MKAFWSFLIVLILAAAAVAILSRKPTAAPEDLGPKTRPTMPEIIAADAGARPAAPETKPAPPPTPPKVETPAPALTPAPTPAPTEPAKPAPKLDELLGTKPPVEPRPQPKPDVPATPKATDAETRVAPPEDGTLVEIPDNPKFPAAKLVKAKVVRKRDGSLLIDGRYRVTGSGTASDPYRVPWDLLTDTKDAYNPQLGLAKLPQRVTMFDGKHLRISGFTAFPLSAQSPREMLVMLNQWDGCCIGVPPTAYDAIEVRLAKAGTAEDKLNIHGTVTGVFQVDPYETNGWLMGLYLMNDASAEYDQ